MSKILLKFEFLIVLFDMFKNNPFSSSAMLDVYEQLTGNRKYFSAEIALWRYEQVNLNGYYLRNVERGKYQFTNDKYRDKINRNLCYSCSGEYNNKIGIITDDYYQKISKKQANLIKRLKYRLIREFLPKNGDDCIGTYYLRVTGKKKMISKFYFSSDLKQVFVLIYDGENETELRDIPNDFIFLNIPVPNEFQEC